MPSSRHFRGTLISGIPAARGTAVRIPRRPVALSTTPTDRPGATNPPFAETQSASAVSSISEERKDSLFDFFEGRNIGTSKRLEIGNRYPPFLVKF